AAAPSRYSLSVHDALPIWFGLTTWVAPGQTAGARLAPVAAFNAGLIDRFSAAPPSWSYRHDRCRALAADWTIGGQTFHSAARARSEEHTSELQSREKIVCR